jgi:hypothetical protein
MYVAQAPFMKELVIQFKDAQEFEVFANFLRTGAEAVRSGQITYNDGEFQKCAQRMADEIEGLVIYPRMVHVLDPSLNHERRKG